MRRYLQTILLLVGVFFLASCGTSYSEFSSYDNDNSLKDQLSTEPTKDELIKQLENQPATNIETTIANTFTFIERVSGDKSVSNVYATAQFQVEELVNLLSKKIEPDEVSDYIDGQQILVYKDYFVFVKESEADNDVTILEVASDEFVRNNYSPNFLSTYFTLRMLDSMLGVDNWSRSRQRHCLTNDCYGGYTSKQGKVTQRGMGSYRGGGPGAGK